MFLIIRVKEREKHRGGRENIHERKREREREGRHDKETHTDTEKFKPERRILNRNFRDKLKIFKYLQKYNLDVNNKYNESQCYIRMLES